MRLVAAFAIAVLASGCGASRPPASSADVRGWQLDRQGVPATLDAALDALERGLGDANVARWRAAEEDLALRQLPTLGRWIEEHWGLRAGSPLAHYFRSRGLDDSGDMAAVILTSFWRRLHYRPLDVEGQIRWHRAARTPR